MSTHSRPPGESFALGNCLRHLVYLAITILIKFLFIFLPSGERRGQPCCRHDSESVRTGCDAFSHSTRDRNRDSVRETGPPPPCRGSFWRNCGATRVRERCDDSRGSRDRGHLENLASASALNELSLALRKFEPRFDASRAENAPAAAAQGLRLSALEPRPTEVAAFATRLARLTPPCYRARGGAGLCPCPSSPTPSRRPNRPSPSLSPLPARPTPRAQHRPPTDPKHPTEYIKHTQRNSTQTKKES